MGIDLIKVLKVPTIDERIKKVENDLKELRKSCENCWDYRITKTQKVIERADKCLVKGK